MTELLHGSPADHAALEAHRVELTGYCYRMLGSGSEAEDAVQETMLRAWRAQDSFAGHAALRSWLWRIATNVCFDMLSSAQRRARPMDLGPCSDASVPLPEPTEESRWVWPANEGRLLDEDGDPAEVAVARETVRLAFVAALQLLPPRQRAVLLLREVLRWPAIEVAEVLQTSVPSVNSALQRARATLDGRREDPGQIRDPDDAEQRALLDRYVDAFLAYDIDGLVGLLRADATMSMPPLPLWLRGAEQVRAWLRGHGDSCARSALVPVRANGMPAYAQWRSVRNGDLVPFAVQVLEVSRGAICGLNFFLDTDRLWPLFGLSETPSEGVRS